MNIAMDGLVPFSRIPVRSILAVGLGLMLLGGGIGLLWLLDSFFRGFSAVWASVGLLFCVTFLCGVIMTSLGILGEYLVRAYEEIRGRPLYIIDKIDKSDNLPQNHSGQSEKIE